MVEMTGFFFLWISLSKNFEIKVDQFYVNQKIRKWEKQSRPGKAFFGISSCVCDNLYKWMDFLLLIWTNEIRGVLFLNFQEFHPNFWKERDSQFLIKKSKKTFFCILEMIWFFFSGISLSKIFEMKVEQFCVMLSTKNS
jgi:hypothetical protein